MKYKSCSVCKNLVDYDEIYICALCKKKYCKNCASIQNNTCHFCFGQIIHKQIDK